ncbi:MAG: histidine kinase, partial [Bacteroidota bacterium]
NVATWGVYHDEVFRQTVIESLMLTGKVTMTYYALYFLLPRLLLPRKYRTFVLWFVVGLIVTGLINRAISYYVVYPMFYPDAVGSGFWRIKIFFEMTAIVNIAALAVAIKLLQHWYHNEQSRKQLAQQKLEAELKLLKSQVHPHFLFNTLNNLYALTLENSKAAPDTVLKLSALLNYMLYECNVPLVPLEKELDYIRDYITLEQLRYGERLDLSFDISGDTRGKYIAPLLLIPFIENSFKHGASQESRQPWVHLNLWVHRETLHMQLENSLPKGEKETADYTKGIGLKNVKRRLDLLYRDRHELNIREEDSYLVVLKLDLDHQPKDQMEKPLISADGKKKI